MKSVLHSVLGGVTSTLERSMHASAGAQTLTHLAVNQGPPRRVWQGAQRSARAMLHSIAAEVTG